MARPAHRPVKLTPEVREKILMALRGGNWRSTAAGFAGIAKSTLRDWMAKGRQYPRSRFGTFRREVMEAEKQAEIRAVGLIMRAAGDDPKHAEWWLERKHHRRWGRRERSEVTATVKDDRSTQAARAIARAFPEAAHLVFGAPAKLDDEEDSDPKKE